MTAEKENWHSRVIERNLGLFTGLTAIAILIGGLVEIIPMYTVAANQPANSDLVAPYTPLELAGRDIYVREGCYNCHSQMVRPLRAETMRYGEWSRGAEYIYDRPFQLGSRRIGPDLHRLGGKYPDAWHYEHMRDPRITSPGSLMPSYPWLLTRKVSVDGVRASLRALARVGDPYTAEMIDGADRLLAEQADGIVTRLAAAGIEAEPDTEMIALIAYMQRLGTDHQAVITGVSAADAARNAAQDDDGTPAAGE